MNKLKNISITKKYLLWLLIPVVIVLIAAAVFTTYAVKAKDAGKGMNIGIDFAGGSVVTVVLGEERLGTDAGFNEHLDKIEEVIQDGDIAAAVIAFAKEKGVDLPAAAAIGSISYSQKSDAGETMSLVVKYDNVSGTFDGDNTITAERNRLIQEKLQEVYSEDNGYVGAEVTMSNIGATASQALINTALLAVGITLILILLYIIIRFYDKRQPLNGVWSGLAAIIALIHDVLIMTALTIIFRIQVNSAFIAAMITIVAYSINNTIVVFDRVREDNRTEMKLSTHADNFGIVDGAVWSTFTRSVNSTLTTMVAIVIFAILGASSVREFALPVIFGLIAGFFSSLCIAPSLYVLMKNANDKHNAKKTQPADGKNGKKGETKYAGM